MCERGEVEVSPLSATLCLLTRWIGRWLDSEPRSSQIQSLFDVWSSQGGGGGFLGGMG